MYNTIRSTFTILFIFICVTSFSQISVSPRHIGGSKNFKKGTLESFKKTTTVFVLSNIYSTSEYETILNMSWKATPFKVVSLSEFNIAEYLDGNYSIATLEGYKKTMQTTTGVDKYSYLHAYIDIYMFDIERLNKKLESLKKRDAERVNDILEDSRVNIARVELFPKDEFIATTMTQKTKEAVKSMFNKDVFNNYGKGFLVNYFQQISSAIEREETLWMYESDTQKGLKQLTTKTLYIPDYVKIRYNPWKGLDEDKDDTESLFSKYDYNYEFISDADLNQKIMDAEDIYYLRYVRVNTQKFIHVVSARTGEMVYQEYVGGSFSYNLKSKHISNISKEVKKSAKK